MYSHNRPKRSRTQQPTPDASSEEVDTRRITRSQSRGRKVATDSLSNDQSSDAKTEKKVAPEKVFHDSPDVEKTPVATKVARASNNEEGTSISKLAQQPVSSVDRPKSASRIDFRKIFPEVYADDEFDTPGSFSMSALTKRSNGPATSVKRPNTNTTATPMSSGLREQNQKALKKAGMEFKTMTHSPHRPATAKVPSSMPTNARVNQFGSVRPVQSSTGEKPRMDVTGSSQNMKYEKTSAITSSTQPHPLPARPMGSIDERKKLLEAFARERERICATPQRQMTISLGKVSQTATIHGDARGAPTNSTPLRSALSAVVNPANVQPTLQTAILQAESREKSTVVPPEPAKTAKPTNPQLPVAVETAIAAAPQAKHLMTPQNKKAFHGSDDEGQQELRKSARVKSVPRYYQEKISDDDETSDDEEEDTSDSDSEDTDSESEPEPVWEPRSKKKKIDPKKEIEMRKRQEQRKKDREEKEREKLFRSEDRRMRKEKNQRKKAVDKAVREKTRKEREQFRSDNALYDLHKKKEKKAAKTLEKFHVTREKNMKKEIAKLKKRVQDPKKTVAKMVVHDSPISTHTDAQPYSSVYFESLNVAFRGSSENLKTMHQFVKNALKLPDDYFLSYVRDPYYEAGYYRGIWTTGILSSSGQRDYGLDLDNRDDARILQELWTAEKQHSLSGVFGNTSMKDGVEEFTKKLGVEHLGKVGTYLDRSDLDVDRKMTLITHFVHKFLLIISMWKKSHKQEKHLRVIRYFFHIMEVIVVGVPLDGQFPIYQDIIPTDKEFRYRLVRDMVMWLPVHVGDLVGKVHFQRPEFYDLARQLFAVILDEWALVMGVRIEELAYLNRIRLASLRLECSDALSTEPIVDMLPFCKPADYRGVTGKEKDEEALFKRRTRSNKVEESPFCKAQGNSDNSRRKKPLCYRPECSRAFNQISMIDQLPHCEPADYRIGFGYEEDRRSRQRQYEETLEYRPARRSRSCFSRFHDSDHIPLISRAQNKRAELVRHLKEDPLKVRTIVEFDYVHRARIEPITDTRAPYHFRRRVEFSDSDLQIPSDSD